MLAYESKASFSSLGGVMHPVNHLSSQTLRGDTTSTCDRQGRTLTFILVVVVVA
jgi:hypothetical protein